MSHEEQQQPSAVATFFRAEAATNERSRQITPRQSELMQQYDLKIEEARQIDAKVEYSKALLGYIAFDLEHIREQEKIRPIESLNGQELMHRFSAISEVIHGMGAFCHQVDGAWYYKIPSTSASKDSLEGYLYPGNKGQAAVFGELMRLGNLPGQDLISSEPQIHQTVETSPWDSTTLLNRITPEVFREVMDMRGRLLNRAFRETTSMLMGRKIDKDLLTEVEEKYTVSDSETSERRMSPLGEEIISALKLYEKVVRVSTEPGLVPMPATIRSNDVYDQSEGVNFFEGISDLERALLIGGERVQGYTLSGDFHVWGRQWLEVGGGLTYDDLAKRIEPIYMDHLLTNRTMKSAAEHGTSWDRSWISTETTDQIINLGWNEYLNKNVDGFVSVQEPYRTAVIKLFSSCADNQARFAFVKGARFAFVEGTQISNWPNPEHCLRMMLPKREDETNPFEIYQILEAQYTAFRVVRKIGRVATLFGEKQTLDYDATIDVVAKQTNGGKTIEQLFGKDGVKAIVYHMERKFRETSLR